MEANKREAKHSHKLTHPSGLVTYETQDAMDFLKGEGQLPMYKVEKLKEEKKPEAEKPKADTKKKPDSTE